MTELKELEI